VPFFFSPAREGKALLHVRAIDPPDRFFRALQIFFSFFSFFFFFFFLLEVMGLFLLQLFPAGMLSLAFIPAEVFAFFFLFFFFFSPSGGLMYGAFFFFRLPMAIEPLFLDVPLAWAFFFFSR